MAKAKIKIKQDWLNQKVSITSKKIRGEYLLNDKTNADVLAWLHAHNHPAIETEQK
jgi:hypothetical protein